MSDQPTKQREGDQALPSGNGDCVQDRIIAEMEASKRVGIQRYGSVLRTFNGRRSIQDAREEARDLFVYLTQIQMEAEATRRELVEVVGAAISEHQVDAYGIDIAESLLRKEAEVVVDRILGHIIGKGVE